MFDPLYITLRHTYTASGLILNVEHVDTHIYIRFDPQYRTLRHTYKASCLILYTEHLDTHTRHRGWSSM